MLIRTFERNNPYKNVDPSGHQYLPPLVQNALATIYGWAVQYLPPLFTENIPNLLVAVQRSVFISAGTKLLNQISAETPEFKIGVGTDPESVPIDQRFVMPVFSNDNPSASEQTQGTQLDVEVKTPLNSDICEITKANVCEQREENKDSEGVKKPEDIKELEAKSIQEKEKVEEKPVSSGGGGGTSGGGSTCIPWWDVTFTCR